LVMTSSGIAVASPSQSPPAARAALLLQLPPHGNTSRIDSVASAARARLSHRPPRGRRCCCS
jgi:hypothetical protein